MEVFTVEIDYYLLVNVRYRQLRNNRQDPKVGMRILKSRPKCVWRYLDRYRQFGGNSRERIEDFETSINLLTICLGLFRFLYLFCLRPFTERQFNYSNKRTKVNLGVLGSVWLLLGPPLLDVIEADAERDRSSQKGHEGALLKLVGQDRGVRFAGWPDCKSEIK